MRITFKLYASLTQYLPPGARGQEVEIEIADGSSPTSVLEKYNVPVAHAHLVLVNGVFVPHDERDKPLRDGDVMAAWPPVAGGKGERRNPDPGPGNILTIP